MTLEFLNQLPITPFGFIEIIKSIICSLLPQPFCLTYLRIFKYIFVIPWTHIFTFVQFFKKNDIVFPLAEYKIAHSLDTPKIEIQVLYLILCLLIIESAANRVCHLNHLEVIFKEIFFLALDIV